MGRRGDVGEGIAVGGSHPAVRAFEGDVHVQILGRLFRAGLDGLPELVLEALGDDGDVRLGPGRWLLRAQLKKDGLLTSDSRVKERKKYGLAGARKRFQFSKR